MPRSICPTPSQRNIHLWIIFCVYEYMRHEFCKRIVQIEKACKIYIKKGKIQNEFI